MQERLESACERILVSDNELEGSLPPASWDFSVVGVCVNSPAVFVFWEDCLSTCWYGMVRAVLSLDLPRSKVATGSVRGSVAV